MIFFNYFEMTFLVSRMGWPTNFEVSVSFVYYLVRKMRKFEKLCENETLSKEKLSLLQNKS